MTSVPFPTAEEVAELLRRRKLASETQVCIERRDDDDGSVDYIVHGRDGDFAACFEQANANAASNAHFLAHLLCLSGELLAAAEFALQAAEFLREHGLVIRNHLQADASNGMILNDPLDTIVPALNDLLRSLPARDEAGRE